MCDCFMFTYKKLKELGFNIPNTYDKYSSENFKEYLKDLRKLRKEKAQYSFFQSFCTEVNTPEKNDIAVSDKVIGLYAGNNKIYTYTEQREREILVNSNDSYRFFRVNQ